MKNLFKRSVLIGLIGILPFIVGCNKYKENRSNEPPERASSVFINEVDSKVITDRVPIHLYFINSSNSKLALEVRYIPIDEAKKSADQLATTIVKELIRGPKGNLKAPICSDTTLHSDVAIANGVATVDFNRNFIEKNSNDKQAEQLVIYSIVNSLTELREIQKVRFLVEGKPSPNFRGGFKFDAPFPRCASLIEGFGTDSNASQSKCPQVTDSPKSSKEVSMPQAITSDNDNEE